MLLFVKNMVCDRCISSVRQQLERLDFSVKEIVLGSVEIEPEPSPQQIQDISSALEILGFELLDKQKTQLIEKIKNQVIELVHYSDLNSFRTSLLIVIAERLQKDYSYLSRLFSDAEGITIEKYIIQQKIEKVKALLEYDEYNLNEIAYKMGYSSSAHLSTQFKAVTGFTPSKYKSSGLTLRKPLDQID
jgi:AraC family transcriptional regulator